MGGPFPDRLLEPLIALSSLWAPGVLVALHAWGAADDGGGPLLKSLWVLPPPPDILNIPGECSGTSQVLSLARGEKE